MSVSTLKLQQSVTTVTLNFTKLNKRLHKVVDLPLSLENNT